MRTELQPCPPAPTPAGRGQGREAVNVTLSIVAPAHNEEANLAPLIEAIRDSVLPTVTAEIILVDDGSTDSSWETIKALAAEENSIRPVRLPKNRGQSAAIWAGALASRGAYIATIDADLQQDPADLLPMLSSMGTHDAVVGYRVRRCDPWHRRLSSRVANGIRNRLTGDSIRDTGCSLKVFRRDALLSLPPFRGMHRFLPTLLRQRGYSVLEHPVSHAPRRSGTSHYNARNRALRSFVDLLAVRWMKSRMIDETQRAREGLPPSASARYETSETPRFPRSR